MQAKYMDIGIPKNITIDKSSQRLHIERKWFGFKYIYLTLCIISFGVVLIVWWVTAFSFSFHGAFDIMFIIVPLVQCVFGLGIGYYVVAGYINKTVIDVDLDSITISQGPLPFWGNKKVATKTILQLFCKLDEGTGWKGLFMPFVVRAITSDQRNIRLFPGLDSSEQALFIEQEVEKFLNIEDRHVKGEIR